MDPLRISTQAMSDFYNPEGGPVTSPRSRHPNRSGAIGRSRGDEDRNIAQEQRGGKKPGWLRRVFGRKGRGS